MEAEAVRGLCAGSDPARCDVPAVAREAADRGVVPELGRVGPAGPVLRHGDFSAAAVLRDGVHGAAGAVAVSESVRGRRVF